MRKTKTMPQAGIGRLLRTASTAFNRVFRMQLAPQGVTYGQFQYLQSLWEADGLTQTELTRKVGVEMASSTAILDSLEERGFIKRARNSSDRRKIHVYLTTEGAALKRNLMACAIATNAIARRGISNSEALALFDIVGRIFKNLKAHTDDDLEAMRTRAPSRAVRRVPRPKPAKPPMTLKSDATSDRFLTGG